MLTNAGVASTPYYVLNDWDGRIGPKVVVVDTEIECVPIYGFSDKGPYDQFCANSELPLKPYPLVKGYLQNQIDAPDDGLKLVVLDAVGPHDAYLHAATMQAVLEAQESRATRLNTAYRLILDQEANAYRVEKTASTARSLSAKESRT